MKRVLVVDDEPDIVEIIRIRLETSGYSVDTACDAAEALECIQKQKPDVITLDILMPGVMGDSSDYGASLCETLKTDDEYKTIPVIIVSAFDRNVKPEIAEMVEKADGYIKKPFDSNDLLSQVADVLNKKVCHQ